MYHIIAEPKSAEEARFACSPILLRKHMKFLKKNNYNVVNLDKITYHIENNIPFPEKTVIITLDDGFKNNYDNAFPIFQEFNIPAIIFLVSGLMEKTNIWMHNNGFPKRSMLSWENIKEMNKHGISFGAHTASHVKLPELTGEKVMEELAESKKHIEDQLGESTKHFAYPYGLVDDIVRDITISAGFQTACSTRSGFNHLDVDTYMLRRLEVYGTDSVRALKQKITFGVNDSERSYILKYYAKRIFDKLGGGN